MELEMAGMVDNPHCSYDKYPRSKRLEMLQEHNTRWEKLDCQWRKDIWLPVRVTHPLAYASIVSSETHLLLLPPNDQNSNIHSTPLPDHPDIKVRWDQISFGKHIVQAKTALHEHDLLVCFTMWVEVPYLQYFPSTPNFFFKNPWFRWCKDADPPHSALYQWPTSTCKLSNITHLHRILRQTTRYNMHFYCRGTPCFLAYL